MDSREKATSLNPSFSVSTVAPSELKQQTAGINSDGGLSSRSWLVGLLALAGAFLWLYWSTLVQLGISWSGDEYYSHGPLLPLISAYLIWQLRDALRQAWNPNSKTFWGFAILLLGLGVAFFGFLVDINFVRAFSIPLVLLGIARICGGGKFECLLRFPILLFAAGVPISRVVVQTFSVPLQKLAAGCASLLLGVMGLSVESDGVNIFTPQYNFVVDVPCSGLKTVTALLTVGLVVAYMLKGLSIWSRILLASSSVLVAIVTNVIRIIIIIMIGIYYGKEAAEGFLHGFSNVVTMVLSLVLLLLFGSFLQQRGETDDDETDEDSPQSTATPTPQVAPPSPAAPSLRALSSPSFKVLLTMAVLLVATQLLGASAIVPQNGGPDRRVVAQLKLPAKSGPWAGKSVEVEPAVFEMLRPDAAVQKRYTLSSNSKNGTSLPLGSQVDVIVIYSSDSRGFHAPEICLRAGGWTINERDTRIASNSKQSIAMTTVTGERKRSRTHLAYFFGDTQSQASGWVSMLTQEALGRVTRKRTGSLEVQFAFGPGALKPNGDFKPELSALMLDVADSVRGQLAQAQSAKR
ncbi:exosortase/archaeosortase family protein [bacterium]|nr:MAG: exosortase/archaeosortase family protein [bacterium]